MTPSDWIAIGALVVAIASIVFNYLTNRENIKARRVEIVTEKSVEIFREFVVRLAKLEKFIHLPYHSFKLKIPISEFNQIMGDCRDFSDQYRIYFPQTIKNDFEDIVMFWSELIQTQVDYGDNFEYKLSSPVIDQEISEQDFKRISNDLRNEIENLIERIQNYIGVEHE